MNFKKICFVASKEIKKSGVFNKLTHEYGNAEANDADVIVALGGDGFMLRTLHSSISNDLPVYGMNYGTVGFLMNKLNTEDLLRRLSISEETKINPLVMTTFSASGKQNEALAINEVSLIRSGSQAAKLKIIIDNKERMSELVCDGALVSTPAGSTAYNYSSHGPILPMDSGVLALTAMAAYRPRRWRGAVLPRDVLIEFNIINPGKRPVSAVADNYEVKNVIKVIVKTENKITHSLLFDPGHSLKERLLKEQFS